MYPDIGELASYGLVIGPAAALRASESEVCAHCGAPPLAARVSAGDTLAWVRAFHPALETESGDELRRLAWDSQLECTIPIPERVLPRVAERLDDELREFAEERFVFALCGLCRNAPDAPADAMRERLLERYARVYFDGNADAAAAQPAWPLAQALTALIASEARRARLAG
jgi:hypothetical protein